MLRGLYAAAVATLVVGSFGRAAPAQDGQEALKAKLEAKLAEPWVSSGGWVNDFDAAKKQAKESGKTIVAYFTRSYSP